MLVKNRAFIRNFCSGLIVMILVGCAGLSGGHLELADYEGGDSLPGIPYYETSLFLLVIPEPAGGYSTEFIELPDPSRPRYVDPWSFWADQEIKLTFKNGVLVSSTSNADATAVPKSLITAAVSAAKSSISAGTIVGDTADSTLKEDEQQLAAPYLFKIETKDNVVKLVGTDAMFVKLPTKTSNRPPSQPPSPSQSSETPPKKTDKKES